uniref:Rrn7/TAF1B N-terminal cyclin domain-containing protein n=1 Tax=Kalanchoe fedtschenkoi TaxID=63787 RepID=A0A7N1A5Z6_KALFE
MKIDEAAAGDELSGPLDFGFTMGYEADDEARYKCTYNEVRMRYVMGIQLMLEMQCKALVESFGVTPLICGLASSIWLRFVAASQVFDDDWADNAISESEVRNSGLPEDIEHPPRFYREFRNSHGERAIMIWYKSLRKMIPLSSSLAVSYLACHVARESVLSTDILKGTLEGKLPYLAAFTEIEKLFASHSNVFPLSANFMFRPSEVVPVQKLQAMAAQVADTIGLELPPVNFHAIASRYLKQMSLPVEKILHHADRVVDWSMPAELWLSVNESRLPSRIYVMAVLIVSIRIVYNIHGFGVWEKSLCNHERRFDSKVSSQPRSECSGGARKFFLRGQNYIIKHLG